MASSHTYLGSATTLGKYLSPYGRRKVGDGWRRSETTARWSATIAGRSPDKRRHVAEHYIPYGGSLTRSPKGCRPRKGSGVQGCIYMPIGGDISVYCQLSRRTHLQVFQMFQMYLASTYLKMAMRPIGDQSEEIR